MNTINNFLVDTDSFSSKNMNTGKNKSSQENTKKENRMSLASRNQNSKVI